MPQATQDYQDPKDYQVHRDLQAIQVVLDQSDRSGNLVQLEFLVTQESLDRLAHLEYRVQSFRIK